MKNEKTNINRKKKKNEKRCFLHFFVFVKFDQKTEKNRQESKTKTKKKTIEEKTQERKQTEHKTKKERTPSFFCNNFWVLQFCLYN